MLSESESKDLEQPQHPPPPFPILPPYHSQFYHHAIPNSTTIPFPILPPYHSQFYHHTIPNFTIISKSTIHCLILLHPTTIFNSTIYCLLATKKSTINQLYQLLLILLHSTTISNSTIYCLFATKNYHTIISFPTYQIPPILLS